MYCTIAHQQNHSKELDIREHAWNSRATNIVIFYHTKPILFGVSFSICICSWNPGSHFWDKHGCSRWQHTHARTESYVTDETRWRLVEFLHLHLCFYHARYHLWNKDQHKYKKKKMFLSLVFPERPFERGCPISTICPRIIYDTWIKVPFVHSLRLCLCLFHLCVHYYAFLVLTLNACPYPRNVNQALFFGASRWIQTRSFSSSVCSSSLLFRAFSSNSVASWLDCKDWTRTCSLWDHYSTA